MRICADCKWYMAGASGDKAKCTNPQVRASRRDPVTGEYYYVSCVKERRRYYWHGPTFPYTSAAELTQCGPAGDLWEQRPCDFVSGCPYKPELCREIRRCQVPYPQTRRTFWQWIFGEHNRRPHDAGSLVATPAGVARDEVQQMLDEVNRELCEKIEALGHRVFEVSLKVDRKPARKR